MAPTKPKHQLSSRKTLAATSLPKLPDPFVLPDITATLPKTARRGRALLSELVEQERTRSTIKTKAAKNILAPKQSGVRKRALRTPLSKRSHNNAQPHSTRKGSSTKKSRSRRASKLPDHPLLRLYEDAILKYQAHLAQDLPNKLAKAKESIEQHLSCVLTETADLPKQFNESCKELSTPLGDLELQIQLRDTNEVYTQPLNKRFENFRAIVKKETANLEQLWERHAAVLDKLEALKSSMASAGQDQNGRARGASTELSYAQNVQQIQRKYKQDRDNVLKRYQKESSGLSERVSKYLDAWQKKKEQQENARKQYEETFRALNNIGDVSDDDEE